MTRRRPGRHPVRVGLATVAALALAACSGELPTSPEPRQGQPVSMQSDREVERFLNGPREGATPEQVVEGFLRANVGFDSEEDVARSFLTSDLASRWVPTSDVLVYARSPEATATDTGQVEVTAEVVGRIDEDGRLTEQATSSTTEAFGLSQVDGEWRISSFPEGFGLWLSDTELESLFRPTNIYYLNTQRDYFVPEVRWLAEGEGLPTAVTRVQLAPLPDHLDRALGTGASDALRLATPSVPVDSTLLATVNLQGSTLAEDGTQAVDLQSQLAHALLGLSSVAGVQVQVGGQPLTLDPDADAEPMPITSATELPYDDLRRDVDLALLRVGEQLIPVDPTQFRLPALPASETADLDLPQVELTWVGLAATADLADLAAVSADGRSLRRWRGEESQTNDGIGDALTAPSVDSQGAFWVGGLNRSNDTPRVWVIEREELDAVARPVEADWLREEERIHSLSVSPDGSRMLLILSDADAEGDHRLVLSGIVRDVDGKPLGLTPPAPLVPSLVDVTVAHWASTGEIVLVGQRAGDPQPRPFSLVLGEWLDPLDEVLGLVDVVPVPQTATTRLIARTDTGSIYTPEGQGSWFEARNGDQLVVPGG